MNIIEDFLCLLLIIIFIFLTREKRNSEKENKTEDGVKKQSKKEIK